MATRGHAAVYEAVSQHDAEGARQAMLDHLAIAVMAWTDPDSLSGNSESAPTASALGR
jgi:DNA-binding FadR family transcriptional regulator